MTHVNHFLSSTLTTDPPHATKLFLDPLPAQDDGQTDVLDSDDEAAEPDDQDGVAGKYHLVSLRLISYHPMMFTRVQPSTRSRQFIGRPPECVVECFRQRLLVETSCHPSPS